MTLHLMHRNWLKYAIKMLIQCHVRSGNTELSNCFSFCVKKIAEIFQNDS